MIQLTERQIGRFWSYVEKKGADECWNWKMGREDFGTKKGLGYGRFGIPPSQRNERSHRIAYTLCNGPIPEGAAILHKCDNSACCNPAHLLLGDRSSNHKDMVKKGRHAHGTTHRCCKLSENDVREIRKLHGSGEFGYKKIGDKYGVRWQSIQAIIFGRSWAHVQ